MSARPKRIALWLAGLALVALVVSSLRSTPIPVDFAEVSRGPLQVTVDEEGRTRVRERFVVSAPAVGRVLRIALEPGDEVVRGETVLATFQPSDPVLLDARTRSETEARVRAAQAGLGQARAERKRVEAELVFANSELARYQQLAAQEVVSRGALEAAERNARTAEEGTRAADYAVHNASYGLEVARASLRSYGDGDGESLEPVVIKAPIDGVILKRLRWSEAVIPAGEPLLELADPADLEIVSDLLSTDAVKVSPGDEVLIERWGGERAIAGHVRRIEPSGFTKISALGVEEQRVNVVVDFADPEEAWRQLGDGYHVELRIVIWQAEDVLKVPTSALFRDEGEWAVFVVRDGVAVLTPVEIGRSNGLEAEVRGGVSEGQEVVVHPSDAIEAGVRVVARSS